MLNLEQAIPCGLIVNELVTNSLKYAFVKGGRGKVTIRFFKTSEGLLELSVMDNGTGLPDGISIVNTATLGLQLVSILSNQLEAETYLKTNPGTEFSIRFPQK